ncbi:MAG: BON domain-containing protein [Ferruginibacter sp.]
MFPSNEDLQKSVLNAIKWQPMLHAAEIGVTARDGVVTLSGVVDAYSKKIEAENAAKSVPGVKAVAEEIEVKFFDSMYIKNDTEIAGEVMNAWKWNWEIPHNKVKVTVENGWVTLEGEVEWNYEKEAAKKSVEKLIGVKGVSNHIILLCESKSDVDKTAVEDALALNWSLKNKNIEVNVSQNKVTLSGTVESIYQKEEAGRIAWATPGIWSLDNELIVQYEYDYAY